MTDNTHGPPPAPAQPGPMKIDEPPITREQFATLRRHEKYLRMRDRIGLVGMEPIELIRTMKHGGYRYKCRRGMPGVLVLDKGGNPVPERMSFRQIAPILTTMSGVEVTYETVRRWWEAVFPDEGDEPDAEPDPEPDPVVPATTTSVRRRTVRRKPTVPEVGDDHAAAIRAATDRAKTTNPDVPSAVFLPPTE